MDFKETINSKVDFGKSGKKQVFLQVTLRKSKSECGHYSVRYRAEYFKWLLEIAKNPIDLLTHILGDVDPRIISRWSIEEYALGVSSGAYKFNLYQTRYFVSNTHPTPRGIDPIYTYEGDAL